MSSQFRIVVAAVVFAVSFSANVSTARAQQKNLTSEQTQIVNTVSTVFTAALTDDVAKFDSVIAVRLLHIRWRRPIQRRRHHGPHQGPTCCGQAL
jgi:hypothetical protein